MYFAGRSVSRRGATSCEGAEEGLVETKPTWGKVESAWKFRQQSPFPEAPEIVGHCCRSAC